jgi:ATP-dependent DNA helicase RecG
MLNIKLTKQILRTTDKYIEGLEKAWITTIGDLVYHFPREYDDRTEVLDNFSLINIKEKNTILVTLLSINNQKTANNKILTKAVLEDKNWFLSEAIWFNRKYLANQLKLYTWKKVIISSKVKYAFWKVTFQSPEIETDLSKIWWTIVPIYPELNYIPSKWIESKILLLKQYFSEITEALPEEIIKKYSFIERKQAFYNVHFPKNKHDIEVWRARLGYEELFEINFKTLSKKYENYLNSQWKSISIKLNCELIKSVIEKLDFELTDKQKITLFQILKDMEKDHAMWRLLEWDVWTWKTIVALIASIHAIKELKIQVTFMAPTEILARQHFNSSQRILWDFWIRSHLLVGSTTKKQKDIVKNDMKDWNIDIIFGTHALVQDDVLFSNLWLVIIDEQHRFWVKQREILENGLWNRSWIIPHSLNMTATPIPRTLALTLYWDQDLSIINQYPKWRKEIFTKVISSETARNQVEIFVRSELEKGRQVFWISPLVEESEKIDLANAVNTYETLQAIFQEFNVGLLHWKMKPKEKEAVMSDFKENKIQVLSSTSVVEVWVDIPNATVMCIEWAERFWLSQLHQFRWRVWRWEFKSHCYLFPSSWYKTERLNAMEKTNNWFELSEIDLEIRWPWEVYGIRQSWVPDLKIASLTDLELISEIREDIEELFEKNKKTI